MNFKLRILPRAERDVQQIFNFVSERSSSGAQRWWNAFHEAARGVASQPHAYPIAAEQLSPAFELRQVLFIRDVGELTVPCSRSLMTTFGSCEFVGPARHP